MDSNYILRKKIRSIILESNFILGEEELEEERIANKDAHIEIKSRQNFVGSHCFGEDLGDLGKMYVVYSYDHPLFVWKDNGTEDGKWYENMGKYTGDNEKLEPYGPSEDHRKLLRPFMDMKKISDRKMEIAIHKFQKLHRVNSTSHNSIPIGEK